MEHYHQSYSEAVSEIKNYIIHKGYSVNDEAFNSIVKSEPELTKNDECKTNSFHIPLTLNDEPVKKICHAHISINNYNAPDIFELNMMIR